jgi:hypothetical protein
MNKMNQPASRDDIREFLEAVSKADMYIKESCYRSLIGLSRTHFYYLKKRGKFDNGYSPNSHGRKKFIHRFYNMHLGKIVLPGLNYTEPVTPMRKVRISNTKKTRTEPVKSLKKTQKKIMVNNPLSHLETRLQKGHDFAELL